MEDKKVAIILSTYNGEKYIKDQIESILNQTYKNIEIYVRDDGSKDGTVEILKEYERKGKIKLFQEENVGFVKSFFKCLTYCSDADYYSFSDQDDVWEEWKIKRAVEMLNEGDNTKPLLYFSDYDFYNEKLEFVSHFKSHKKGPSFRNSIVDCINMGIGTVINKKARDIMVESNMKKSCGHDWSAYMICSAFGNVIYDKVSSVKYRRIENNVSAGGKSFISFQLWRIKKYMVNNYFKNIKEEIIEFESIFGDKLKTEDKKVLNLFTSKKYNFIKAMKRVFYKKMFRQKILDEIMLRFMFFIGKL